MFYTKLVWQSAIPNKILPFIKKGQKVSSQLLYFCHLMKLYRIPGALLVICLLFADAVPVAAQDTWSLQRCVDFAMSHNIQIKQQDVQKRLAELTYRQSQLSQVPTLGAAVNTGYNFGRSIDPTQNTFVSQSIFRASPSMSAGADLFNWFSKRNNIAANKYEAQANSHLLDKAKNDVAFNIATTFLQILLNNEQVNINKVAMQQTKSQLENTKKLVLAGSVPESNQADLEAQLARDSGNLVTAENNVVLSILQMKAYLNLGFDIAFQPEIPANISNIPLPALNEVDPEMVYSAAISNNPLVKADSLRIRSLQKAVASARGTLFPTISIGGDLSSNYSSTYKEQFLTPPESGPIGTVDVNGTKYPVISLPIPGSDYRKADFGRQMNNNFSQSIGLSLNIPILNMWQLRTNYNKSKLNLYNQQLTRDADNQKLRQDIYTAHANALAAIQKFYAATKGVEASQKAYDFATKRFNLGLMNTIDYITTQNNLFQAQINKVSAQYDYIFKMKLLEFYRDQRITL